MWLQLLFTRLQDVKLITRDKLQTDGNVQDLNPRFRIASADDLIPLIELHGKVRISPGNLGFLAI